MLNRYFVQLRISKVNRFTLLKKELVLFCSSPLNLMYGIYFMTQISSVIERREKFHPNTRTLHLMVLSSTLIFLSNSNKNKNELKILLLYRIQFSEYNFRCQVNLIDFQSQRDMEDKRIVVYQDRLIKFVFLKMLTSKVAEEVVCNLGKIFMLLRLPPVLRSDDRKKMSDNELINLNVILEMLILEIIHCKFRHSQRQSNVERANQDIQNMLCIHSINH